MRRVDIDDIIEILKKVRPDVDFYDADALVNNGIIDSLDLIYIIQNIEEKYSIKVDFNMIEKADFNSAADIQSLIHHLMENGGRQI